MARIFKMHELGRGTCKKERKSPLNLTTEKDEVYKKAVAVKDCLAHAIDEKISDTEIEDRIRLAFDFVEYKSSITRLADETLAVKAIERYRDSDKRLLLAIPSGTVKIPRVLKIDYEDDFYVEVSPDRLVQDTEPVKDPKTGEILYDMSIEVIKYKFRKPGAYDSGNDIGLYSMLKYGESLVPKGKKAKVKASYYFLIRKDDQIGLTIKWHKDYFDDPRSGAMIKSMTYRSREIYEAGVTRVTSCDQDMAETVKEFLEGKEKAVCSDKECKHCKLRAFCNYAEPPKVIPAVMKTTPLENITLSDDQQRAVDFRKGIMRINAGAGSGKTTVIAIRVAMMIMDGADPSSFLITTFTDAAAKELFTRINQYVNEDNMLDIDMSSMRIMTMNSFGQSILDAVYADIGFTEPPHVQDDVERMPLIDSLVKDTPVDGLDYAHYGANTPNCRGALATAGAVFRIIKEHGWTKKSDANKVYAETGRYKVSLAGVEQLIELYDQYDDIMRSKNYIEYADQERMMMKYFEDHPYYLETLGIRHIIVDEFQDSNDLQIDFLHKTTETSCFESLMVVGDDNQAIYAFRGTTPENIINFDKKFDGVITINLGENYRSCPPIIDFANEFVEQNFHRVVKKLIAMRTGGKPVEVEGFLLEQEEIQYTVTGVKKHIEEGVAPEQICIILRDKTQIQKYVDALSKEGIPTVQMNPERYLDNSRVLGALGYFELYRDATATLGGATYLNAIMGNTLLEKTQEEVDESLMGLRANMEEVKELKGADKKAAIIKALTLLDPNEEDEVFQSFLKNLSRKADMAEYAGDFKEYIGEGGVRRQKKYPGVVLTTAHSSKGLEWPIVYCSITKFDNPLLHTGSVHSTEMEREEVRRLIFVSATRARDELYLTSLYDCCGDEKSGYQYNSFLVESCRVLKKNLEATTIEAARNLHKQVEEQKKKDKAKASAEKRKKKEAELIALNAAPLEITPPDVPEDNASPKAFRRPHSKMRSNHMHTYRTKRLMAHKFKKVSHRKAA